ncbi:recombinase family protein [Caballeronia udeis]|uniref:recombinase family protein n=1 Tax=Caballeronia udeis TaxID=1232866 RepID=UPI00385027C8
MRDSDTLVVHSLDRLARNVEDLLRTMRNLNARRSQPVAPFSGHHVMLPYSFGSAS